MFGNHEIPGILRPESQRHQFQFGIRQLVSQSIDRENTVTLLINLAGFPQMLAVLQGGGAFAGHPDHGLLGEILRHVQVVPIVVFLGPLRKPIDKAGIGGADLFIADGRPFYRTFDPAAHGGAVRITIVRPLAEKEALPTHENLEIEDLAHHADAVIHFPDGVPPFQTDWFLPGADKGDLDGVSRFYQPLGGGMTALAVLLAFKCKCM